MRNALHLIGVVPLIAVCVYRLLTLALNARSWQLLLPRDGRPTYPILFRLRWIGESVNGIFPVGQVGGNLVRARLIAARGVPGPVAVAAMVGDLGVGIATQVVFGNAAAIALVAVTDGHDLVIGRASPAFIAAVLTFSLVLFGALFFFLRAGLPHVGAHVLARSRTSDTWLKLAGGITELDRALAGLMARGWALGWHLAGWFSQVGETWILLALFGAQTSLSRALAIEGLSAAARAVVFFIPGGIGVQEVTVVALAGLVGVPPAPALALGIAKRAREVVLGAAALVLFAREEWPSVQRLLARWRADRAGRKRARSEASSGEGAGREAE